MSSTDVGLVVEGAALLVAALTHASTVLPLSWQKWIVLATFARFALAASLVAAVGGAVVVGRWPAMAITVAVAALVVAARVRQWRSLPVPACAGPSLTVLTANLLQGAADPATVVAALRQHEVDVLFAQEVTAEACQALLAAGVGERLPHSFIEARPGGGGTAIWSRLPLSEQTSHEGFWFAVLSARLQLPDGSPLVCAAHLSPPWPYPSALWAKELPLLRGLLDTEPGGRPVIVGGDFNATLDHPQFRALLRGGLRDAAAQAGRPRLRTWPADRLWPVFGIDHVLLASAVAREVRTVRLARSDHLGVLARVQLPGVSRPAQIDGQPRAR